MVTLLEAVNKFLPVLNRRQNGNGSARGGQVAARRSAAQNLGSDIGFAAISGQLTPSDVEVGKLAKR
jgi:hypothetical protein